jgi:response regulator RpfG family c-di-GMP phosphodiesterase
MFAPGASSFPFNGGPPAPAAPAPGAVPTDFGLPADHGPTTNGGTPPTARLRCVVADDEPRLRQVLCRLMRMEGFDCVEAGTGVEALAAVREQPTPLLLSDLRMPQMDGFELLARMREHHPDTAVVMITAVSDVDMAVRALASGATDYLTKPFHLDEVRARVAQALEKRRLRMENREHQERLEERVQRQARRIEELFLAAIQSLVQALEVKDPYTRGHSDRVSRNSGIIARALGLDEPMVREVELGGHVHDIGKIGVREAVLNKPGPLTDEEYSHIMTHPVVGWQILAPLMTDAPLALIMVRSHHERYDGRGIPDGLAGEAIPLVARIAAVADAFDAMTSSRAYRPGSRLTVEAAVAEMERHRGTQFDPAVLDVALELIASDSLAMMPTEGGRGAATAAPPVTPA